MREVCVCVCISAWPPERVHITCSHCYVGVSSRVLLGQEVAGGSPWHGLLENRLQHVEEELPKLLYILDKFRGGERVEEE